MTDSEKQEAIRDLIKLAETMRRISLTAQEAVRALANLGRRSDGRAR